MLLLYTKKGGKSICKSALSLQFYKAEAIKLAVQAATKSIKLLLSHAYLPFFLSVKATLVGMKGATFIAGTYTCHEISPTEAIKFWIGK